MQEGTAKTMPWTYNCIQYSNRPNLQKNSQQTNRNIGAQDWYFESAKLKQRFPKFKLIQYHLTPQQKFIILNPYYPSLNPQDQEGVSAFFEKEKEDFYWLKQKINACVQSCIYMILIHKKSTKEYRINQSKAEFCFDNLISVLILVSLTKYFYLN